MTPTPPPKIIYFFVLIIGDGSVFSAGFDTADESQFSTNSPASLTLDCEWDGYTFIDRGAFNHMSHVQWLKVVIYHIYKLI